jgi:steroid delta-isomerase-like uncharacterized protein
MSAEQNIATAKRAIKAINDRDWGVIPHLLTPNFVRHDLAEAFDDVRGRESFADFLQLALKALPDYKIQIDDMFAVGDRLAMRFTASGMHQGELLGYAPTGKVVKISQINLYRFDGDKVAETWQLMDVAGFLRQIGALPTFR